MNLNNTHISPEQRARIQQKRNRAVLSRRLWSGLRQAIGSWKGIFVLLLGLFAVAWRFRDRIIPIPIGNPALSLIYDYTIAALIVVVFLLLLAGLLVRLGTPPRARRIEDGFLQIGHVDRCGFPPAVISRKRVKGTKVNQLTFWSPGVGRELWDQRIEAIQDMLNMTLVEPVRHGGRHDQNRNIIIVTAAPGVVGTRKSTLYDDEL